MERMGPADPTGRSKGVDSSRVPWISLENFVGFSVSKKSLNANLRSIIKR